MSVNRVSITINSRGYTVVAEESVEYIERLGNHINEKVESVIRGGQNIIGERPVVLAALNICDEYFKAVQESNLLKEEIERLNEKNQILQHTLNDLHKEIDLTHNVQMSIDDTEQSSEASDSELAEARNKIKSLEGHIKGLEHKIKALQEQNSGRNNRQTNSQKQGKH